MSSIICLLLYLVIVSGSAQDSEKIQIQKTIESFFEAFHQQDSTRIRQMVYDNVVMQRIAIDSMGKASIREQDFNEFLKAIVSIPKSVIFKETIKSYSIQIEGVMANVWTPYTFSLNGKVDHCGVNSFQLFKNGENWKIIYIIDTGRKEGCVKGEN